MGLDATIRRSDGKPLGEINNIQEALAAAFPGIVSGRLPAASKRFKKQQKKESSFRRSFAEILSRYLRNTAAITLVLIFRPNFASDRRTL